MLITSIFSFSHNAFNLFKCKLQLLSLTYIVMDQQILSIWTTKRFCHLVKSSPFPKQTLVFTCLQCKAFENTIGKGETACNKQFLFLPHCFLPVWRTFCHFMSKLKLSSAMSFSLEECNGVWERVDTKRIDTKSLPVGAYWQEKKDKRTYLDKLVVNAPCQGPSRL